MSGKYIDSTGVTYLWSKIKNEDYKSLYNLGAYDTISGNVITRQTGYVNGKDYLSKTISKNGVNNPYLTIDNIYVDYIENIIGNCNRVDTNSWWNSTFSQVTISYDSTYKFLVIMLPNGATDTSSLNNIYIQYKLATATTEKVEKNHYARYNQTFILDHNKNEAERSANLFDTTSSKLKETNKNALTYSIGSITADSSKGEPIYGNGTFIIYDKLYPAGTYSIKLHVTDSIEDVNSNKCRLLCSNNSINGIQNQYYNYYYYVDFKGDEIFKFTSNESFRLGFVFITETNSSTQIKTYSNIMLNEGSEPLPYQAYEGKVVHEKGLESANVNYATTAGSAINSQYLSNVATISGGNTATYPWRRIMSIPSTTANYKDTVGTYYLSANYNNGPYYLFRVEFRTENSSAGGTGNSKISIIATNSNPNNLAIASYSVATNGVTESYSDIFVKVSSHPRMTLTRLSAPDNETIKYYYSREETNASRRIEAYTGINGSGTGYASYDLYSLSEYTFINYGELTATYLPLTGGVIDANGTKAPLILKGGAGNYRENLRLIARSSDNSCTLAFIETGKDELNGMSANSWAILVKNGGFYIVKGTESYNAPIKLTNIAGTWKVNDDKTLIHEGNVVDYLNSNLKTINGNSIVGSGNLSFIADSVFTEVTDVIDSFIINKNGTWLITCLGYNKIYASDNSTISFYGSALVSMTSVGSDPHICINGTAYACSSAITFVTSGIMQVYKKAN